MNCSFVLAAISRLPQTDRNVTITVFHTYFDEYLHFTILTMIVSGHTIIGL